MPIHQPPADVALFRTARSTIAESIWWNPAGTVEWCDITNGLLHRTSRDGESDDVLRFAPPLSAFQPTADGGYVASSQDTVFTCDRDGNDIRTLTTVHHRHPGIRFNEAKCDPFGNYVVGSMDVTRADPDGAIYVVTPAGGCRMLVGGLGVANGFEWTPDGSRMWFTDTSVSTIYVADYDGEQLQNIEPFITGRHSDGLARDAAGGFWNGIYDDGVVVRWDSDGAALQEFDVAAGHVTSVGFGGTDLSTLFIGTARENLTEEQLDAQPLSGSLFTLGTNTHGFPVRAFGA